MAIITKTVGTVGRDYSTIAAGEADADNASVLSTGDDFVLDVYNDSVFDEAVTMDGGGTLGINSFVIEVPQAERHDGTAGTGARIVTSASKTFLMATPGGFDSKYILRGLEIDQNGNNGPSVDCNSQAAGNVGILEHCIIHSQDGGGSFRGLVRADTRDVRLVRCVGYDNKRNTGSEVAGFNVDGDRAFGGVFNCTVWDVKNQGSGNASCIRSQTNDADGKFKNNIAMNATVDGAGVALCFNFPGTLPDSLNNMSDDATADDAGGTGHLINQSNLTQFTSTVLGSEDLHIVTGSDAKDAGTTLTGINNADLDIDGVAVSAPWDIGADEFAGASETPVSESLETQIEFEAQIFNFYSDLFEFQGESSASILTQTESSGQVTENVETQLESRGAETPVSESLETQIEFEAQIFNFYTDLFEFQGESSASILTQTESSGQATESVETQLESRGAETPVSESLETQIEFEGQIFNFYTDLFEFQGESSSSILTQTESSGQATESVETQIESRGAETPVSESLGTQLEFEGQIFNFYSDLFEFQGESSSSILTQTESSGQVTESVETQIESGGTQGSVFQNLETQIEAEGQAFNFYSDLFETRGFISGSESTGLEWIQDLSTSIQSEYELLKEVSEVTGTDFESLVLAAEMRPSEIETRGFISESESTGLEWIQDLSTSIQSEYELLKEVSEVSTVGFETRGLIVEILATQFETRGFFSISGPTELEWLQHLSTFIQSEHEFLKETSEVSTVGFETRGLIVEILATQFEALSMGVPIRTILEDAGVCIQRLEDFGIYVTSLEDSGSI